MKPTETKAIGYFNADGTWSLASAKNQSRGTYRWITSSRIEQTVVESGIAAQVGTVSIKDVHVTPDRLELVTSYGKQELERSLPPPKLGQKLPSEMVITTIFMRIKE